MYLIAGRPPEHVSPEPLCGGPPCPPLDPESLCASSHISRTASALALPGFGYTPDFASLDTQPSSPRYVRLQADSNDQGCNDLGLNCGFTRYDSLPSVSRKQLLPEAAKPADLPEAQRSPLIRVASEPNMPTLLNGAQLQSVPSPTPQSPAWAWGLTPLFSTSPLHETTARSADSDAVTTFPFAASDTVSLPAQSAASIPSETSKTDMHSELSQHADELSNTSAGSVPLLGAVPPRIFQMPSRLVIETSNDSCDVPKSDLQPEAGQTAASS